MSSGKDIYIPPRFLFHGHLETIYPALLRRVSIIPYTRERIATPDNDFLDLDWLTKSTHTTRKVVIISHGLEGNSHKAYVKGMAKAFFAEGFDVVAWNYRGCSGEMNKQLRFYHSGATDDLDVVINHIISKQYTEIYLVGFSLGGNVTLKYLGERLPSALIQKAVVFSVPMHLESSCNKISQRSNWIYANRFLKSLKKKILMKSKLMPVELDSSHLKYIKTLQQFDDCYTAPLHGFKDAVDYYTKCSSLYFAPNITIPTLIINSLNDPFLSSECFPIEIAKEQPNIKLEIIPRGGHVGYAQFNKTGVYWSEIRAVDFVKLEQQ